MQLNSFLLTHSWADQNNAFTIFLYASTGKDSKPVKITISNHYPLFFVKSATPNQNFPGLRERKSLPLKSLDNSPIDCLYFNTYGAMREAAATLRAQLQPVYESDVHPVDRYLMERFVKGGFSIDGDVIDKGTVYEVTNPKIRGCTSTIDLSVMSIDLETNAATNEIYSIACSGESDIVFMQGSGPENKTRNFSLVYCSNEAGVIKNFIEYLKKKDPDIIVGWNVIEFDFNVLAQRAMAHNLPLALGRGGVGRVVPMHGNTEKLAVRIPGRVVLDIPSTLRANFYTFDSYSLENVSHQLLGKHKLIQKSGTEKIAEINNLFSTNKPALAQYNLEDTRLTLEIIEHTNLLSNVIERSRQSGLLLDRLGGSVAAFDFLFLPRLHRRGYVAGDVLDVPRREEQITGGYVMDPLPGIYRQVAVLDFKSLYPSIIRTFLIDPLGLRSLDKQRITTPAGTTFSKTEHILPEIIADLLTERNHAKARKNASLSQAIKILMNSFYGVLGTPGCRFFSTDIALSITRTGQYILKKSREFIEQKTGFTIIYGDTDSLFILLGERHITDGQRVAEEIVEQVNAWWKEKLAAEFNAESALELEFEKIFNHFLMPQARGSSAGSKKHYCGTINTPSGEELLFKGMESARSDWTDLAKDFQKTLCFKIFREEKVDDYIIALVHDLKQGLYDDKLIYKKRIRKKLHEYTVHVPPHVQAARQLPYQPPQVHYVITVEGPQPVSHCHAEIDYEHYIDSQLRPVADTLLAWSNTNFEQIINGQQDLFA